MQKMHHICGAGFCEAVAEKRGETGNEHPSWGALQLAYQAARHKPELARLMSSRCLRCLKCKAGADLIGVVGVVTSG